MDTVRSANLVSIIRHGVTAGAAGGLAEIAWVSAYAIATGGNAADLARGVTIAAGADSLLPQAPIALGIAIHMVLAIALGLALAGAWHALRRRAVAGSTRYAFALTTLAGVWAFNFLVLLPVLSPAFVVLAPFSVSLTSKLLFGAAAAEVLRLCASDAAPTHEYALARTSAKRRGDGFR